MAIKQRKRGGRRPRNTVTTSSKPGRAQATASPPTIAADWSSIHSPWAVAVRSVLRATRQELGYTQRDAEALAGVPQSTISDIESGARHCSVPEFLHLLVAYKVNPILVLARVVAWNELPPPMRKQVQDVLRELGS